MAKPPASCILFPLLLAASGVLVLAGGLLAVFDGVHERRLVGCALLGAGAASAFVSAMGYVLFAQLRAIHEDAVRTQEQVLSTLTDRLSGISVLLNVVTEQQLLSDRARAVAYRDKDRETLRRAIREELGRNDWEAARVLVNDMEGIFGYRQEAERFREEIDAHRSDGIRQQMREAQLKIDKLCATEDWVGGLREAKDFIERFADFAPAKGMAEEVEARRKNYKTQLLDRFNDAVLRHDADTGIAALKRLDPYLTPAEGERLAESARSIFNDRKQKLKDVFSHAVTRGDWTQAITTGELIQREFPNSQMALEIRDTMDTLRDRAREAAEEVAGA